MRLTVIFFQLLQDYDSIVLWPLLFLRSWLQMVFVGKMALLQMFLRLLFGFCICSCSAVHFGADLFLFILFRIHVFSLIHNVLYQFWNFSAIISTYFLPLISFPADCIILPSIPQSHPRTNTELHKCFKISKSHLLIRHGKT